MAVEESQHPWVHAANVIELSPMPSYAKWDPITATDADGNTKNMVLLTTGTPSGVMSIFVEAEQLDVLLEQGAVIQKMWKNQQSSLVIARPADMKREVRAQNLLGPMINGHDHR